MKFLISALLLSNLAIAKPVAPIAGAIMRHDLTCKTTVNQLVGSSVSVQVFTQALAPEFNTRGMNVITKPVVRNAEETVIQLKQTSQTAYNAVFKSKDIKAELDKGTFVVELQLGAIEYKCK